MKCNQPGETGSRTLKQAAVISAVQEADGNNMVSALIGNLSQVFHPFSFSFQGVVNPRHSQK